MTAKKMLATSAAEATKSIGGKVDQFIGFLKPLSGLHFSNEPFSVENSTLQFGEKYAVSYTGSQSIQIEFSDLSLTQKVVDKAVQLEMADISQVKYRIDLEKLRTIEEELLKEARGLAKADSEKKAKELERKLGKFVSADESRNATHPNSQFEDGENIIRKSSSNESSNLDEEAVESDSRKIRVEVSVKATYETN